MRAIPSSRTPRRRTVLTAVGALLLAACEAERPDAYGNFESVEVDVSAEATGTLLRLDVREGERLTPGEVVAQIDSVQLALQKKELEVQRQVASTRGAEAAASVRSLQAQLRTAEEDLARTRRLIDQNAATASELSRLESSVESLQAEIAGARARIELASHDQAATAARIEQIEERLARTQVRNPVAGTVLTTFAEEGEYVQQGRPLYTIAPLDTLVLRAYVSGGQLAALELGGTVEVRFDAGDGTLAGRSGRISWISPSAEFTPTPIQTREERVDQVYAVKVRVPNPDGRIKIGMPGELVLDSPPAGEQP